MIKKDDLSHWFHGWSQRVRTTVPVQEQDPSRCGTGQVVDRFLTCNGAKSCQMIKKDDLRHWFYGRTPGFCTTVPVPQQDPSRCGTGPLVDPWLTCNGAKSCQMIKKDDLTHWFHGRTPGLRTTVPVPQQDPSCCGTGQVVDPWLTCNCAKSCQMIKKDDLRHWFYGRTPGFHTTVPVPQQNPSRCGTAPLVIPWLTCKWCQKLPND